MYQNGYNLYLDDERTPTLNKNWVVVRSFQEFKDCIIKNGLPVEASLDHDLGCDDYGNLLPTGLDCLKWLFENSYDISSTIINVHSSNMYRKEWMESFIKQWKKVIR
jgi:hypothetical protein